MQIFGKLLAAGDACRGNNLIYGIWQDNKCSHLLNHKNNSIAHMEKKGREKYLCFFSGIANESSMGLLPYLSPPLNLQLCSPPFHLWVSTFQNVLKACLQIGYDHYHYLKFKC